jgi:hypothetical protein
MTKQCADQSSGYLQTLSFMSLVQSEVRDLAGFSNLVSETCMEHLRGAQWQRHSICEARWTLTGEKGTIEVHASHANDFGCSLVTKITCKSDDFGPIPVVVSFGGDYPQKSSVPEVVKVLSKWLPMINKPGGDPFAEVSMPRVS